MPTLSLPGGAAEGRRRGRRMNEASLCGRALCRDVTWRGQEGPSPQGDPPPASPAALWGAVQGVWAELEVANGIPITGAPSTPPAPSLPSSLGRGRGRWERGKSQAGAGGDQGRSVCTGAMCKSFLVPS